MPTFLSPGVFTREIDLSVLPADVSSVIPAFIGTANKGPVNKPMFITTPDEFISTFGNPMPTSNLGYAVLGFLEEGNACWVLRVAVKCDAGQPAALSSICVDLSGTNVNGWGRIPVFQGIDFGRIFLRVPSVANPFTFHPASVHSVTFNDFLVESTFGPSSAMLTFSGSFTGPVTDVFTLLITSNPGTSADPDAQIAGAGYQIIRGRDGLVVATGVLAETAPESSVSTPIPVGSTGLTATITVTTPGSGLNANDTFTWVAEPDNRVVSVTVEGVASSPASFTMPTTSYTDPAAFVAAFNALIGSQPFFAAYDGTNLMIRTAVAGNRIQLVGTEGFCLHVGVPKWAFDIPRSHIQATLLGPYNINTNNNRVAINLIEASTVTSLTATIPVGVGLSPVNVAAALDLGGISAGAKYYDSYALQLTDTSMTVIIAASATHQFGQVQMLADFSHIQTLNFSKTAGFLFPWTANLRVFSDARVALPASGVITPSNPLSCETAPLSAQCALDAAYFNNIVGFFVAASPGTWLNGYTASLVNFNGQAGRWTLKLFLPSGLEEPDARVDNFSFDVRDARYIANLINPGSTLGGVNGSTFIHWEERPSYLQNDPTSPSFVVRAPGGFNKMVFTGMADGIPADPSFHSELDRAVIGNPADSTGIFAFQNPETFDITLLVVPGNSSGAVIGQGLQMCEARGDCMMIVDPPFGLRPQQVVDWHNGMLLSDLTTAINSSYGALYWSWIKIFDQFNGGEIFIPPSGHIAGVYARTARVAETWFAPAGLNRGRLLTVLDLEVNPTLGERDLLYGFGNAVNPLVNFPKDGITVWGQRTLQRKQSALDRVNVRMLLIALKKQLIPLLRTFIFEPNDKILWGQVVSTLNPSLADIVARRGITAFKVICDATNNTPIRRDRNELWVSVLIKPTRAVEFVVLNLVVLRTDASFAAEEVLAAAGVVGATNQV